MPGLKTGRQLSLRRVFKTGIEEVDYSLPVELWLLFVQGQMFATGNGPQGGVFTSGRQ
jgi:hypothetical protein